MAVIVMHNQTRDRYVFLGAGYGQSEYAVPDKLVPGEKWWKMDPKLVTKESRLIAGCDADGRIHWLPSDELVVVSINDKTAHQILSQDSLR